MWIAKTTGLSVNEADMTDVSHLSALCDWPIGGHAILIDNVEPSGESNA